MQRLTKLQRRKLAQLKSQGNRLELLENEHPWERAVGVFVRLGGVTFMLTQRGAIR